MARPSTPRSRGALEGAACGALLLAAASATPAAAQRADSVAVGARVRARLVYPPPGYVTGTLVRATGDTLAIAVAGRAAPVVLRRDEIAQLERSVQSLTRAEAARRGARRGARVGLGAAAVLVGVGLASDYRTLNGGGETMVPATLVTALAGVATMTLTTVVGGAIGRADRDRWARVPLATPVATR